MLFAVSGAVMLMAGGCGESLVAPEPVGSIAAIEVEPPRQIEGHDPWAIQIGKLPQEQARPARDLERPVLQAKQLVEKTFSDPTQREPVTFRVIEDASPVDAVLREANQFDLVVIGVAEQWGLESHLFGFRPERIVEECTRSILIVRHFDA